MGIGAPPLIGSLRLKQFRSRKLPSSWESHFRERKSAGVLWRRGEGLLQNSPAKRPLQGVSLFFARVAGTVPLFRDLRRWRIRKRQSPS
jgi:hypothetical protein